MKCELEKITIHYKTFGEGKPIIMLHGWLIDHRVMVSTMEPIFKDRDGCGGDDELEMLTKVP
jgi:pimeloyl-ACP methyl ester carboxylesterase